MSKKEVEIDGIGTVTLAKSRKNKTIRLSVNAGKVRVSMPMMVPYATGVRFLTKNMEWVMSQMDSHEQPLLSDGQRIGKLHTLYFTPSVFSTTARVTNSKITVPLLSGETSASKSAQQRADKACIRALRQEAEIILPPRLRNLSELYDYSYKSIRIKQLKRRWGSCDSHKNIILNLFLLQLPFELIDYVICHELAHTKHMNHSPSFWSEVEHMVPDYKKHRKLLKNYQTEVVQNNPH